MMAGRNTSHGRSRKRAPERRTGIGLSTAPGAARTLSISTRAQRASARGNESVRDTPDAPRFDDDDVHRTDEDPDLGVIDTDDPWEEDGEWDRPRRPRPQPEIRLWREDGRIAFEVRPVAPALLEDPFTAAQALRRSRRLEAYAGVLADWLHATRLDGTLSTLWGDLPATSGKAFAQALQPQTALIGEKAEASSISNDRELLVALPGCTVALGVLLSKKGPADAAVQEILRALQENPSATKEDVKRAIADPLLPARAAHMYIGWVQLAQAHPWILAQYQAVLREDPARYETILEDYADRLRTAPPAPVLGRQLYVPDSEYKQPPLLYALVKGMR